uniref:Uncharacterized protein n=1 Tax=Streptomyces ribosidificus TaxID=80859 RepID=Q2MFA6_STRRI|nr:hypothetical protein [Streptomyces ribosidificus]
MRPRSGHPTGISELRAENVDQRGRIQAKQAVICYLLRWVHRPVDYIEDQDLEPPPPPQPVPEIARPYLQESRAVGGPPSATLPSGRTRTPLAAAVPPPAPGQH